ncbi:BTB/POZ and MATH domain-containing protein 1-like [Triticum dicoccoides]|uniref:BTB/POZ and MATH domain-containing protein 1-like n=1 Tax=Triticum dicoccoides TaxID=85692 RepID=UPI001891C08B|nr:BTB/POZ and MATH domain-containing protein 1-like [Triticum dicoccoides]
MAASQGSIVRVPSRRTQETTEATVAFEIAGYSLLKGLDRGEFLSSPPFSISGYEWCILYYPNGSGDERSQGYASVFLKLLTKNALVRAFYRLWHLDAVRGHMIKPVFSSQVTNVFGPKSPSWGFEKFMKTTEMTYVRNDCLVMEWEVRIIKETLEIQVPPSELSDNLATLLEGKKGADVTFKVQGEIFFAHKILLAMRSAVFDAKFYGPMAMGEKESHDITIDDMQPSVFKAFLHFIYTDSLPSMVDLDDNDKIEMVKHLLVAADKYAMERMKVICEGLLCKSLDVETVATILALAEQYHCSNLKDACIEFMLSSNRMNDVLASQGYLHLKRSFPDIIVDLFERTVKSRKI